MKKNPFLKTNRAMPFGGKETAKEEKAEGKKMAKGKKFPPKAKKK